MSSGLQPPVTSALEEPLASAGTTPMWTYPSTDIYIQLKTTKIKSFLKRVVYLYEWVFCLQVHQCNTHVTVGPGDQKRELDFLELELHVVSHHVGVGTEPRSSTRAGSVCHSPLSNLSSPWKYSLYRNIKKSALSSEAFNPCIIEGPNDSLQGLVLFHGRFQGLNSRPAKPFSLAQFSGTRVLQVCGEFRILRP